MNPSSSSGADRENKSGSNSPSLKPDRPFEEIKEKAGDAVAKLTDVAQRAGSQAKEQVSSLAADAKKKTKGYFNQQVAGGADLAGHVAESVKCAGDNLADKAPQLAEFVQSAADKIQTFSEDMRGQSVDDLLRRASDFTRRQPALVFGIASLTGFFLFRVLKAKPANASTTPGTSQTGL